MMQILFAAISLFAFCSAEKLKFVIHISNVGAHFPTYVNASWATSMGGLTSVGMRQYYLLGREFRKRYIETEKHLPEQYNSKKYLLRAAVDNTSSTMYSAQAFASGLYVSGSGYSLTKEQIKRAVPPGNFCKYQNYYEDLRDEAMLNYYNPIPVIVHGGVPDQILSASSTCDYIGTLVSDYKKSNESLRNRIKERQKVYVNEVYKILDSICNTKINAMEQALKCYDYILSARYYAQPFKDIENKTESKLKEMYSLVNYEILYGDIKVAQTVSYGLFSEMIRRLNNSLNGNELSMISYFIKDREMLSILRLMKQNVTNNSPIYIPVASALVFEIYKDELNDTYFVRAIMNKKQLMWEGNRESININEFVSMAGVMTLEKFKTNCNGPEAVEKEEGKYIGIIILLLGIVVIILSYFIINCIVPLKSKNSQEDFEFNQTDNSRINRLRLNS